MSLAPVTQEKINFAFLTGKTVVHLIIFANRHFDGFDNAKWFATTIQGNRDQAFPRDRVAFCFPFPQGGIRRQARKKLLPIFFTDSLVINFLLRMLDCSSRHPRWGGRRRAHNG